MFTGIKVFFRNLLPKKYQVPIKYWNDWRRGTLEEEMKILGEIVRRNDHVIDVGGNRGIYTYLPITTTTSAHHTVSGLKVGVIHQFRVAAITPNGISDFCAPVSKLVV